MKSAFFSRLVSIAMVLACVGSLALVLLFVFFVDGVRRRPITARSSAAIKSELVQLGQALENFHTQIGSGYPPSSNDDPEVVRQFLAKAFPKYHGDLPETYKHLDPASSLVFWLGGRTDKNGKMIGFKAPIQRTLLIIQLPLELARFTTSIVIACKTTAACSSIDQQMASKRVNLTSISFKADSKGEYHEAWHNCHPCRSSVNGSWINPTSYQLFSPGLDGKYGQGIQYPSGADYDEYRKDDLSNFTDSSALGGDIPQ